MSGTLTDASLFIKTFAGAGHFHSFYSKLKNDKSPQVLIVVHLVKIVLEVIIFL